MTSGLIEREYLVQQLPDAWGRMTAMLIRAYTRGQVVKRYARAYDIQAPTKCYVTDVGGRLDNTRLSVYTYEVSPNIDVTLRYETNPTGEG